MEMETIKKHYPEFGYSVEYKFKEDFSRAEKGKPGMDIDWLVLDDDGNYIMSGVFKSHDYYRSNFNLPIANMEENVYESLFYLYFEEIKLECIRLVEDIDSNETEVDMDYEGDV